LSLFFWTKDGFREETMRVKVRNIFASAALISCAGAVVFGQQRVVVAPSPSSAVTITPVAQNDPATAALFAGDQANLQPVALILSNQGSQPILGIVVVTTATNQAGRQTTSRDVKESFLSSGHPPVLNPGSSLLVIPTGVWIPTSYAAAYAADRGGAAQLTRASEWIRVTSSSQVSVSVDAIVLASGEVDGPDTTNFMGELGDRRQAAESVIAAINGPSPGAALSQLAGQPAQNGNRVVQWQLRFAQDYGKASSAGNGALVLGVMQAALAVPQLFRGTPNVN
jgi:hypothetical protein